MTTLTIELPDEAARQAEAEARRARVSVSEWIAARILGRRRPRADIARDDRGYPLGWFEQTHGSLADVQDLVPPADTPPEAVRSIEL